MEETTQAATVGRKDDAEKLRYDLIPLRGLRVAVKVLTFGARKYAPENWRFVERPRERYAAAAKRHLDDWLLGESRDPQSGESHLAHALCCLLFLAELEVEGKVSA